MFLVDSPFADRLHTNYTPSGPEMEQLRILLVEPTNELAQVDAQIAEMHVLIGQLRAKQASLQAEISAHTALMSPIRRAPLEILQEIFLACLPTTHDALIDPGEAPLLLGCICKHWRSVAYSTPMIWSSIHIPPIKGPGLGPWNGESDVLLGMERKLGSFVQAWLDRSRACPLSISLSLNPYGFEPRPQQHPVISQITLGSSHIRSLNLCVHVSEMQSLLLLGVDDLPLLENLHIQCPTEDNHFPINHWNTLPIFQVPTLQRISLQVKADALALPLRWSRLIDLNLECFSEWSTGHPEGGLDQKGALELLHRCPNLVWCRLHATKPVPFTAGPSLTLPHLRVLILAEFFDYAQVIKRLVVPKLRYLGVGRTTLNTSLQSVDLSTAEFTLEIDYMVRRDDILALLMVLPGISHLRVLLAPYDPNHYAYTYPNDEFLARLGPTSTGTLCPALIELKLGRCSFGDAALLKFIQARMTAGHPLSRIEASFPREMDVDVIKGAQQWIAEGLQVNLRYEQPLSGKWEFDGRAGLFEVAPFS
ncbi:hypothetical protein B0H11DRAFT_2309234 [Mycena galericulata]|nr:hypothetical protein B0H11DRAFT_2309234 [Mycena galericulata]